MCVGIADESKTDISVKPQEFKDSGDKTTYEPLTGVGFPERINGMVLVGTGCRYAYVFVKVYAIGVYVHESDFEGLNEEEALAALLDPKVHRLLRLVLVRNLTASQYLNHTIAALKPHMGGQDHDILELIRQNPDNRGGLPSGTQMHVLVYGPDITMDFNEYAYKVKSLALCKSLLHVHYSEESILPSERDSCKKGVVELARRLCK